MAAAGQPRHAAAPAASSSAAPPPRPAQASPAGSAHHWPGKTSLMSCRHDSSTRAAQSGCAMRGWMWTRRDTPREPPRGAVMPCTLHPPETWPPLPSLQRMEAGPPAYGRQQAGRPGASASRGEAQARNTSLPPFPLPGLRWAPPLPLPLLLPLPPLQKGIGGLYYPDMRTFCFDSQCSASGALTVVLRLTGEARGVDVCGGGWGGGGGGKLPGVHSRPCAGLLCMALVGVPCPPCRTCRASHTIRPRPLHTVRQAPGDGLLWRRHRGRRPALLLLHALLLRLLLKGRVAPLLPLLQPDPQLQRDVRQRLRNVVVVVCVGAPRCRALLPRQAAGRPLRVAHARAHSGSTAASLAHRRKSSPARTTSSDT
jgi:hypothetical protein